MRLVQQHSISLHFLDVQPPNDIYSAPDNPPWGVFSAIFFWIASVILIFLFPAILVVPYVISQGIAINDQTEIRDFLISDPTAIVINVIAIFPAHLATLVLGWIIVTQFRSFDFREMLGWNWGPMRWWNYCIILGLFFIFAASVGYYFPEQDNDLLRILRSSRTAVYLVAFLATFTAPLVEEIVYRGVIYSALQRAFGVWFSVATVTFMFALVHVPQYIPSYSTIFLLTVLSLILTLVRVHTGNLLPCIVLHTIFNGVQSALLIIEPWLEQENIREEIARIVSR